MKYLSINDNVHDQVIVFVFFGQKYLDQFLICHQTIPNYWNVKVIADVECDIKGVEFIKVDTPPSVYEMLTYRKNIHYLIDINKYSQVWYSDPDILFTGDILAKYKNIDNIMLSVEPKTSMRHPCMAGVFSESELLYLESIKAPAINGGFYMVPKNHYEFFEQYATLIDFFSSKWPNDRSTDQHVLNNMYHRKLNQFQLFTSEDFGLHARDGFKLVNHYIGMDSDKIELMNNELIRLQNA